MPFDSATFAKKAKDVQQHLQGELQKLRTGRASVQLLDSVRVEAYGTQMQLQEVAQISAPDHSLLVVKPYDSSLLEAVEKAIHAAELNLSPVVGQDEVKVPVPALTAERRQELVKVVKQKLEESQVLLRNLRAEVKREIESSEGQAGVSEDDIRADIEALEKAFQKAVQELEQLAGDKEKALLEL